MWYNFGMFFDEQAANPYTMGHGIAVKIQGLRISCGVCGAHFTDLPVVLCPISSTVMIGKMNRKRRDFEIVAIGRQACRHLLAMRFAIMWSPLRQFSTEYQVTFYPGIAQAFTALPSRDYSFRN